VIDAMTDEENFWRNPPAIVRIATISGVYCALGVMGGMYVNLLPWFRINPTSAAIAGAVLLAPIGAWFEAEGQESSIGGDRCA
jgi:hypothetical protein